MKKIILIFLLILLPACNSTYNDFRIYPVDKEHYGYPGSDIVIALKCEIPKDSHIYGNPLGTGIGKPTTINITAPDFIYIHPTQFLPPKIKHEGKSYINFYENEVYFFIPIQIKDNAPEEIISLKIFFDSLLCSKTSCIAKKSEIEIKVNISAKNSKTILDNRLLKLYGESNPSIFYSGHIDNSDIQNIQFNDINNLPVFTPVSSEKNEVSKLWKAIIFGLIGGLILNFMPCVLPVISLKIMSFVQHADNHPRKIRLLGLSFTGGILVTFLVLAALASWLGYSWGALFQNETFILIMTSIVFALTLSLFDVYTLNIPGFASRASSHKQVNDYADAFVKGLFATLLATPCSGPFLGATLAWALTGSPIIIFSVFISIGIGMSLPYLLLSFKPSLIKKFPKPGAWLLTFERILGFLLLATTLYLLMILPQSLISSALWFMFFIAFALWQFGKFGNIAQKKSSRIISAIMLLNIIAGGYFVSFKLFQTDDSSNAAISGKVYSHQQLLDNYTNNKITMIKFTADWCPNCKLVEATSLNSKIIAELIQKNSIDFMVADITKPGTEGEELLNRLGGKSIPYLAIFSYGDRFKKPFILRDIYSKEDVVNAIKKSIK